MPTTPLGLNRLEAAAFVSRATGYTVRERVLRWWEQHKLVRPIPSKGRGRYCPTLYRVHDLVAAQALAVLRRDGASLQRVRKALRELERMIPEILSAPGEWRLAVMASGHVCRVEDRDRLMELSRQPGQFCFFLGVGEMVRAARDAVELKRTA